LPVEVAKVQAQLKLPFGKPADSKVTDLGVTVGCLKTFPANAAGLQSSIKTLVPEILKGIVIRELDLEVERDEVPSSISELRSFVEDNAAGSGSERNVLNMLDGVESLLNSPAKRESSYDDKARDGGETKTLTIGMRGGINFSSLSTEHKSHHGSRYKDSDSRTGFQGGLAFDIAFNDLLHIQPGIMYMHSGTEWSDNAQSHAITIDAIELPALLSLKISAGEGLAIRAGAGGYIAYGIGGSYERKVRGGASYAYNLFGGNELGFKFSRLGYGLKFGGGFEIGNFYLGTFYNYGLAEMHKGFYYDDYGIRMETSTYMRSLGFDAGYNF
jgi:hypothetical protein